MQQDIRNQLDRAIRRFLEGHQLKYKVDDDGDYHLVVGFSQVPIRARMLLLKQGAQGEILSVVVRYEGPYVFSEEEALRKANKWNMERRWPRIYWRDGHFYGDFHLDCEVGISQRLVELTLHRVLMGSLQFLLSLGGHQVLGDSGASLFHEEHSESLGSFLQGLLDRGLKTHSLPN